MLRRSSALLMAALVLVASGPLPGTHAQDNQGPVCEPIATRHLSCIEALHADPAMQGVTHNLYAIAWRPVPNPFNGLHEALIVGGIPGEFAVGLPVRSLVLLYDGVRVSRVFDKEGPQLVDVAWAPDGSYALVVSNRKPVFKVDPPRLGKPQYEFKNLWDDCGKVDITNCNEAPFYGHQVAFNPSLGYAWITGSSLLQYDGDRLTVVDPGTDIAWRSIGWEPSGRRAMLSALVCVEEGKPGTDVPCVGNVTASRIVPSRLILADTGSERLCEVGTYGRFNVQKAEANGITWTPDGRHALIYGDDDFHGTIMKFDATVPPTGTGSQGCPQYRNSFSWINFTKAEGEFNDMSYHPRTGRFWAAAGAGQEVWEGTPDMFRDVFGEHDLTGGKGTIYYGIAWDPTDRVLLISGFGGKLYKYIPANQAFTRISTPKDNSFVTSQVLVAGRGFTPSQFDVLTRVEVQIVAPDGPRGWRPANITGTFKSVANWTFPWDTDLEQPGLYQVQARSFFDGNWSNVSNRTVQVVRSQGLAAPTFQPLPPGDPDGNYTLRWSTVQHARGLPVGYELEEAGLSSRLGGFGEGTVSLTRDFAFAGDERLIYKGANTTFDVLERRDGQYFYRVRAVAEGAVSPWSAPLGTVVAIDSDGDGFSDAEEVERGSSPFNATSSPDDLDGDGVPNRDDAFPYDPSESRDSDGDGTGDKVDRYPLDPRECCDSDSDGWGDNAERRLASNPFDAVSTPDTDDDQDGCLNKDEAAAGTNAKNPLEAPSWCKLASGPGNAPRPTPLPAGLALAALGAAAALATRRRT